MWTDRDSTQFFLYVYAIIALVGIFAITLQISTDYEEFRKVREVHLKATDNVLGLLIDGIEGKVPAS